MLRVNLIYPGHLKIYSNLTPSLRGFLCFKNILKGHGRAQDALWQVSFEEFQSWIMADAQQEFASKLLHKSSTPAGGRKKSTEDFMKIWDVWNFLSFLKELPNWNDWIFFSPEKGKCSKGKIVVQASSQLECFCCWN